MKMYSNYDMAEYLYNYISKRGIEKGLKFVKNNYYFVDGKFKSCIDEYYTALIMYLYDLTNEKNIVKVIELLRGNYSIKVLDLLRWFTNLKYLECLVKSVVLYGTEEDVISLLNGSVGLHSGIILRNDLVSYLEKNGYSIRDLINLAKKVNDFEICYSIISTRYHLVTYEEFYDIFKIICFFDNDVNFIFKRNENGRMTGISCVLYNIVNSSKIDDENKKRKLVKIVYDLVIESKNEAVAYLLLNSCYKYLNDNEIIDLSNVIRNSDNDEYRLSEKTILKYLKR